MCISLSKNGIHVSFIVVFFIALYSTLELDLDIVGCFLEDQEIKLAPKTHILVVLLVVVGQPV